MDIVVRNCNSIEAGNISLRVGRLNVKYGPNGIGKSTLAKAIALRVQADRANAINAGNRRSIFIGRIAAILERPKLIELRAPLQSLERNTSISLCFSLMRSLRIASTYLYELRTMSRKC